MTGRNRIADETSLPMQRSHGERMYAFRRLPSEKWPLSRQFVAPQLSTIFLSMLFR